MNNNLAIDGGIPVRSTFLPFASPLIENAEIEEVVASMKSGWLVTGLKVAKFQEMFKEYSGAKHAIGLNSCTAGLHLALVAMGIGEGDEVITTPMTFCATANVIIHVGAKPVFADCEKYTMNIDPLEIEKKITSRTKAIIPVHFAGRPCNMDEIMKIANKHGLKVVEDCAHAIETEYKGKKAGTFGDISAFSFYATKNIVTGEGGMAITNNDEYAEKLRIYSLHGMSRDAWKRFSNEGFKHYQVVFPGYKYNMMDLQAAIGIHQLPRIEKYSAQRKLIWDKYNEAFKDLPVFVPPDVESGSRHALHMYNLLLDLDKLKVDRDAVLDALTKENIGVSVHYPALHLQPYYVEKYGFKKGDYPNTEFVCERTMSIPLTAKLSDQEVEDVIHAITKVLKYYAK